MNISDFNVVGITICLLIGVLAIIFAHQLADNLKYWPLINHAGDAGNPLVYRISGVVIIILTVIVFIFVPLAMKGHLGN